MLNKQKDIKEIISLSKEKKRMRKYLYIFLGSLCLFLGMLGLITPGLPTTPFILLTGYLYAQSSPRLYAKLKKNKLTGACLRSVDEGVSTKMRIFSISFMWVMVLITAFLIFNREDKMRYIMILLGIIGTVAQLIALRKKKPITNNQLNTESKIIINNTCLSKAEENVKF